MTYPYSAEERDVQVHCTAKELECAFYMALVCSHLAWSIDYQEVTEAIEAAVLIGVDHEELLSWMARQAEAGEPICPEALTDWCDDERILVPPLPVSESLIDSTGEHIETETSPASVRPSAERNDPPSLKNVGTHVAVQGIVCEHMDVTAVLEAMSDVSVSCYQVATSEHEGDDVWEAVIDVHTGRPSTALAVAATAFRIKTGLRPIEAVLVPAPNDTPTD
ncbi:MAG TPA: hypothetical protein PLZ93_01680 [Nocardioides sp.]|uniref:hypothetical protein n=1 Tax=uncultured Nocardioides sp. TaxID=198441 RepID=UPI0026165151|nr:hypothetical protein [uncultured Nocardioides sp.]HRI94305.1 hypothetical protein [Nocardioides sp.]HRK44251.1 hypothetical protein [Nocardioides sp.]